MRFMARMGRILTCACGGRVMVIGLTGRQWSGLVKMPRRPARLWRQLAKRTGRDLRDEGVRWELRHEITEILRPWFAARRIADFGPEFDKRGLTWSVFRTVSEAVAQDPDLSEANPMFSQLDQTGLGRFPVPGFPGEFSAKPRIKPEPAPPLASIPRRFWAMWRA